MDALTAEKVVVGEDRKGGWWRPRDGQGDREDDHSQGEDLKESKEDMSSGQSQEGYPPLRTAGQLVFDDSLLSVTLQTYLLSWSFLFNPA